MVEHTQLYWSDVHNIYLPLPIYPNNNDPNSPTPEDNGVAVGHRACVQEGTASLCIAGAHN